MGHYDKKCSTFFSIHQINSRDSGHTFGMVKETKRQANDLLLLSSTPASFRLLYDKKETKRKTKNGCEMFFAYEFLYSFYFFLSSHK